MYHDHNMLVTSSLLQEPLGPVYLLVEPTMKCSYIGQVIVMSDYHEGIRSLKGKLVGIPCDHE